MDDEVVNASRPCGRQAQLRKEGPGDPGGADHVDVQHPLPLFVGESFGGPEELNADVRYHQVDPLEPVEDSAGRGVNRRTTCDVDGAAEGRDAMRRGQRCRLSLGALSVAVQQSHAHTSLGAS